METKNKTAVDVAFEELEETFGNSKTIRREIIGQLRKQICKIEVSDYDKPVMIQSRMMIAKTLDDLLKSDDDAAYKKLKVQLARKDSETNGVVGAAVVNILKNIKAMGEASGEHKVDPDETMSELKKMQEGNEELTVTSGELEECGSTPTNDGIPQPTKKKEKDEDDE